MGKKIFLMIWQLIKYWGIWEQMEQSYIWALYELSESEKWEVRDLLYRKLVEGT